MKKFGLVTIVSGRRLHDDAIEFTVETFGEAFTVIVEEDSSGITASVVAAPQGADAAAAQIPLRFSKVDVGYQGRLTLPTPSDSGWSVREPSIQELQLAVGDVGPWLNKAGGTSDGTEVRFATSRAVPVVACVATRVLPFLTGHDLAARPPWEVAPPSPQSGRRLSSAGSGAGGGGQSIVERLDLHAKLLDALQQAIEITGAPRVEYGVIEHLFAYENPEDYRELHEHWGHRSVDPPLRYSITSYLAGRLADLKGDDVAFHGSRATGFWSYNTGISAWSAVGVAPTAPLASWSEFAVSRGWHPNEWRAAALLWGEEPVTERFWSGFQGPGEPSVLTSVDVPAGANDKALFPFIERFDAPAAFGDDLAPIYKRIRSDLKGGRWVPRDMGLLRATLWAEHRLGPGDEHITDELLRGIRMMLGEHGQ